MTRLRCKLRAWRRVVGRWVADPSVRGWERITEAEAARVRRIFGEVEVASLDPAAAAAALRSQADTIAALVGRAR